MNPESNDLARLLNLNQLFSLYQKIGDSIHTDIDLYSSGYDYVARKNSLKLLICCGIIVHEDGNFTKIKFHDDIDTFATMLLKDIRLFYSEIITEILSADKRYDENRNLFYIFRNSIDLRFAGMLMLLGDLSFVQLSPQKVYILHERELEKIIPHPGETEVSHQISLIELEHGLVIKKQLGELGERKAFEYEVELLRKQGIAKSPKIISDIDVGAGYDIVSFSDSMSETYDKFIEVKSCQNLKCSFYLSQNELRVAREKGEKYNIYLYIREEGKIIVINNPYQTIYQSDEWAKESQIYKIHRIS